MTEKRKKNTVNTTRAVLRRTHATKRYAKAIEAMLQPHSTGVHGRSAYYLEWILSLKPTNRCTILLMLAVDALARTAPGQFDDITQVIVNEAQVRSVQDS